MPSGTGDRSLVPKVYQQLLLYLPAHRVDILLGIGDWVPLLMFCRAPSSKRNGIGAALAI